MKRFFAVMLMAVAMLSMFSCTNGMDEELAALLERMNQMETKLSSINEYYASISKLVTALEDHDMIRSVTPIKSGANDAYLITFASGQTITLIQGIDGISPTLGIRKYEDGLYYWTVQYGSEEPQWLLSNIGLKIRASGLTPQMKIEDGWWQYSYDNGATWVRLCAATGNPGTSVFKNLSVTDYYVTFVLSDNKVIQVPTEAYFKRITDRCQNINNELSFATLLLEQVDENMSVKSISQIKEGDRTVGYVIELAGGGKYTIRCGEDEQPFVFTIRRDQSDWVDYWMVKVGDGDYEWVTNSKGDRSQATALNGTPNVSVRDTLGGLYFVYSFYPYIDDYQLLLDSEGNPVSADVISSLAMFKSVVVNAENVALTLADGTTVNLPLYSETVPSITFGTPTDLTYDSTTYTYSSVRSDTEYVVPYTISNTPATLKIDAIGLDGVIVTDISQTLSGKTLSGNITFRTPAGLTGGSSTVRVLVFLTWGSNVTMQVLEFYTIAD